MLHFMPASKRACAVAAAYADSKSILLIGEPGTGKARIAEWIHLNGPRAGKIFFQARKSYSLAEQLMEVNGGTLFIEEVYTWKLEDLAVLQSFLQSRAIRNTANNNVLHFSTARAIMTTRQKHKKIGEAYPNLSDWIDFKIEVPRLAHRTHEFEDIVYTVLQELAFMHGKEYLKGLTKNAWRVLKKHAWPGNIRELRNVLRVAVVACSQEFIDEQDLPDLNSALLDFQSNRSTFEKSYILNLLNTFNGDLEKTSNFISIKKSSLLRKLESYGIIVKKTDNSTLVKVQ